jgi:hypothetical protein
MAHADELLIMLRGWDAMRRLEAHVSPMGLSCTECHLAALRALSGQLDASKLQESLCSKAQALHALIRAADALWKDSRELLKG